MNESLFGNDFEIKVKEPDIKDLVKKAAVKKEKPELTVDKLLKSKKVTLQDKLDVITSNVLKVLGKQKDNILVIKDRQTFDNYIDKAIKVGRIAIDTETNNSLDPITCKIMGLCLYVPGEKQAYIPINHIDNNTGERFSWQCTEQDIKEELQKILDYHTFTVFHNYKFDYKVIKCTCGIEIMAFWDTLIASKLIDENEASAGLKQLYIKYIDQTQEKYAIDHLFTNIEYAQVDPDIFAFYAATDAMMTDKLYLWQKPVMESEDFKRIYKLFKEVEMPCIQVVAEMELNGILFDTEYAKRLQVKFEAKLKDIDTQIATTLDSYAPIIKAWRIATENQQKVKVYIPASTKMTQAKIEAMYTEVEADGRRYKWGKSKADQLDDPIKLSSPSQLAILFYDILKLENNGDRGTGEEVLESLKNKTPLAALLLERRGVVKLLDAFIISLPKNVNSKTGKIHCSFNQYGAKTGRFSSSEPNLQQSPSHMKSIRMLFMADPGYKLIGSDFSQQEPRLLSFCSRDKNMIEAYQNGKDLYATIAMGVYNKSYWDCMEHHENGSPNPEGKKRRASCKAILLGIMYGRGAAAIAEQIHSTKETAQKIIDDFYKSFPTVKAWMDNSLTSLTSKHYVEDFYGRRRRLEDIALPKYTVSLRSKSATEFNPLLNCQNRKDLRVVKWEAIVREKIASSQTHQAKKAKETGQKWAPNGEMSNMQYEKLAKEAIKEGVVIQAFTGRIAQAKRQCVNAIIQGSASTMTKIAMNKIFRDPELNKYGFKLCISVHDELIGEVKEEYAEQAAQRLCDVMKNCVKDIVDVPFKCDPSIVKKWYEDEMAYQLQDTLKELVAEGKSEEEAKNIIIKDNSEFLPEEINHLLAFNG